MEHEEAEEGSGNGSKTSIGRSDAASNSAVTKLQALRLAEDLSLPSVQVVVMSANMGCSHCRQRVTKVVSKMNGLLDYMVDFGKKEVTVRGAVHTKRKKGSLGRKGESLPRTRTLSWFLGCYGSSAPS